MEDTPGYFVGKFQANINTLEMVKLQTIQKTDALYSHIDSSHLIFGLQILQIISNILKESTIYLSKSSQQFIIPLLSTNQRNPKISQKTSFPPPPGPSGFFFVELFSTRTCLLVPKLMILRRVAQ